MIETHPFDDFVPPNAKYLLLGSFIGKEAIRGTPYYDATYDWFYGTKRNQFWPILEEVYGMKLKTKHDKQELFTKLGISITDIIHSCERQKESNLDNNLTKKVYNMAITGILENNEIEKVFFTSRDVEREFKREFREIIRCHPAIELIYLPSPSPRYAKLPKDQKVNIYKEFLPKL